MANAPQPNGPSQQVGASSAARGTLRVPDYDLKEVIGDRGTGTVYVAQHLHSDRQVAIKILHSRRQDVVDGLVRGATTVSRVHHPNLVEIMEVGATRDGTVFLAMELLTGESLQDRLRRTGTLPPFDAINIVRQVAHGLGAAHAAGVVHGGLEPAKIFLCRRDGRRRVVRRNKTTETGLVVEPEGKFDLVKILDLGLKRFLDLASYQADVTEIARYWSPEQAQRRPIDVRSDIYSLGAVFYEMITGTVPFDGSSLAEVLRQHVSGMVTAPSQRTPSIAIDALVDTVILRCLQKTPALRFASTDELCDALDACVTDCAFLRDAHRLPGIEASGIDLPAPRAKPVLKTEEPKEPAAQAPALQNRRPEIDAARPAPSPVAPKPRPTPPIPSVARTAAIPTPGKVVPPPMPVTTARLSRPATVTPPAPPRAPAPPETILTVDQSDLMEIQTPTPIALSSDLLTEIADAPAVAVAEPEKPAAAAEVPAKVPETIDPVEAPARPSHEEGLEAALASPNPVEPPASRRQDAPAESDRIEPEDKPVAPQTGPSAKPEGAVRGKPEGDAQDGLLAGAWEFWRRPKGIALTGIALVCVIGLVVWAGRGKSTTSGKAPAQASPTTPSPVAQTATPPLVASAAGLPQAAPPQAAEPSQAAPAQEEPSSQAVAPSQVAAPSQAAAPTETVPPTIPPTTPQTPPPKAETPAPAQVASPDPAPVAAEPEKSLDKRPASAAVAPSNSPAEVVRPSKETPTPPSQAATSEPKSVSPKPRPTPTAVKEASARDLAPAPAAPTAPKQAPAAPANLPPRLAAAWSAPARPTPPPTAPGPAPNTSGKATTQSPSASAAQLVREAQQAWLAGQHAFALSRAQAALAASPKPAQAVQAYEIVGTSSCALRRRDRALEAASHLDASRRESVKAACAKNGVPFE